MTNPLSDTLAELEQEEAADRATLIDMLSIYIEARDKRDGAGKDVSRLAGYIRQYLDLHPGEELWDAERNIVAFLQPRKVPGRRYDVSAIIANNPRLWQQLIEHGCLELNEAAIKAAGPNVGGVEKYAYPQGMSTALMVVKKP